jgi:gluconate 2-dehydrogenase
MNRPAVLVARAVFPETLARLREHFDVQDNPDDRIWSKAELIERLQGKAGAFTTGSERIDAEVLAWWPTWRWGSTTSTCRPAPPPVCCAPTHPMC